jgi:hypothetical protein
MIGEKIKIGFDGSEVKRGLGGIMGGFGKLKRGIGRATRQVGVGAARRMGSDLFGFVINGLQAIPNELGNLSMLNKELDVMAQSTGVAKDEYLAMRQAMSKATGKDLGDAADDMRDISERVGEALADPESTPGRSMRNMGIFYDDIAGKNIVDQIDLISKKFSELKDERGPGEAMFQIVELLGDQAGKNLIPFFLNYEKGMKDAREVTKGFAGQIDELGPDLEAIFDIKQSVARKFSQLAMGVLGAFKAAGLEAKSISDLIDSIDVAGIAKDIANFIAEGVNAIKEGGLWEWIKSKMSELGDWFSQVIGDGISKAIKNIMPDFIPDWLSGGGGSKDSDGGTFGRIPDKVGLSSADNTKIEQNTGETNRILERLATGGITGVYA